MFFNVIFYPNDGTASFNDDWNYGQVSYVWFLEILEHSLQYPILNQLINLVWLALWSAIAETPGHFFLHFKWSVFLEKNPNQLKEIQRAILCN